MRLEDANVSIVGLGLIGGSLTLALDGRCRRMVGVDVSHEARRWAAGPAPLDKVTSDLAEGLQDCDLCILATPVGVIVDILGQIGKELPSPRFVLDVGSTKNTVVQAMNRLPENVHAVGGHPFGGKETSGPWTSEAGLFGDCLFALVPTDRTTPEALELAEQVVTALGAKVWLTHAEDHDRRVALTSQLPFVLAVSLMAMAKERASADPELWDTAASGFLDTTRLAASSVPMMRDILLANRPHVQAALHETLAWLEQFTDRLSNEDIAWISTQLSGHRQARQSLTTPMVNTQAAYESHDLWPGA
jgi:prephenate dehydrogenase